MSRPEPVAAIITWASTSAPAVQAAISYRGSIEMPGGEIIPDKEIARPGNEEWHPDQLVHPLTVNVARIHGDLIGGVIYWQYAERPVVGTCEDLPGGGGTIDVPIGPGDGTPVPGRPGNPATPIPTGGGGLAMFQLRGGSGLMRMALGHSTAQLAEFIDILQAAQRVRDAERGVGA